MSRSLKKTVVANSLRPKFLRGGAIPHEIVTIQDGKCRNCGGPIARGEAVFFRSWGIEYAHKACGWLRPDEHEPHELTSLNGPRCWEWACSTCGRHTVAREKPTDLRCGDCLT